jgi:hypothetical protein
MHSKDDAPHLFRRALSVLVLDGLVSPPIVQWLAQTFPTQLNAQLFPFVDYGVAMPLANRFAYGH